jgi:hypothetical protein
MKRGKLDVDFLATDPAGMGAAGRAPWGSKVVQVYKDVAGEAEQAAGIVTHEAQHVLDKLTPTTYKKTSELRAYLFQKAAGFLSKTESGIRTLINTHPLYQNVPGKV